MGFTGSHVKQERLVLVVVDFWFIQDSQPASWVCEVYRERVSVVIPAACLDG